MRQNGYDRKIRAGKSRETERQESTAPPALRERRSSAHEQGTKINRLGCQGNRMTVSIWIVAKGACFLPSLPPEGHTSAINIMVHSKTPHTA